MRKNMAPRKKQKRNKKAVNRKTPLNKKSSNNKQKNSNDFSLIFTKIISTILAKPFFLINLVINRAIYNNKKVYFYII